MINNMEPINFEQLQELLSTIAELQKENASLRKQLKSACNALMENNKCIH